MLYYQIQIVKTCTILPYHQLMTPSWLSNHSAIIGQHSLNPQYLEILSTNVDLQRRMQVQLVPPKILTSTDCISVTMTIAMDTVLADSRDHDPSFGISDGNSFVGFVMTDHKNYHEGPPCKINEGDIVNGILTDLPWALWAASNSSVTSRSYSSEAKMQIRPTEQWGSCHTEHDEGYTNIENYQRTLDLTNGLYLEMYSADAHETYRIKYIVVDINVD